MRKNKFNGNIDKANVYTFEISSGRRWFYVERLPLSQQNRKDLKRQSVSTHCS
jgi:hypothetical protein